MKQPDEVQIGFLSVDTPTDPAEHARFCMAVQVATKLGHKLRLGFDRDDPAMFIYLYAVS